MECDMVETINPLQLNALLNFICVVLVQVVQHLRVLAEHRPHPNSGCKRFYFCGHTFSSVSLKPLHVERTLIGSCHLFQFRVQEMKYCHTELQTSKASML